MRTEMTMIDYWDNKILSWDRNRYSNLALLNLSSWTVRRRMSITKKLIRNNFSNCNRILDLGCGTGQIAKAVTKLKGISYRGFDFSNIAVTEAQERFTHFFPQIQFQCVDICKEEKLESELITALGLFDWLDKSSVENLFKKIDCDNLIFSYTETNLGIRSGLYQIYRKWYDRRS